MHVSVRGRKQSVRTVSFDRQRNAVLLVEQRLLPHRFEIFASLDYRSTARAITDMVVRVQSHTLQRVPAAEALTPADLLSAAELDAEGARS